MSSLSPRPNSTNAFKPSKVSRQNRLSLTSVSRVLGGSVLLTLSSIGYAEGGFAQGSARQDYSSNYSSNASSGYSSNDTSSSFGNTSVGPWATGSGSVFSSKSAELKLPDLGSGGGRFLEANQHKILGEWALQQLSRSAPMLGDPWMQEQLETLVWRINAQARTQAPLALVVLNNPTINAFAIPGGVMGMHTGTVIESNSMDELASVVAHEVAHLSQRHYEHRDDANKKALMMQIGGMLAAIAASAAGGGDAATAVMMGSQTAALNSQMAFSRSNEREADRIGMQLMAKSGYDPRAMPKFFATLNQKTQLNRGKDVYLPSFIMTHPLSSERLSEAQSRANSYDNISLHKKSDPLAFDLLKWRAKVLTKQTNQGELMAAAPRNTGASMALVYWYGTQGRYSDAEKILNKLKQLPAPKEQSDKVAFDILLAITEAEIAGMRGKWDITEQVLKPYYNLYPERRDLKLLLSDAWLQNGKYDQVIKVLKPMINSRPYDVEALFRMQRAYELMALNPNTQGNTQQKRLMRDIATINALRYRGRGELWRGKYEDALVSVQQAKTLIDDMKPSEVGSFNKAPLLATVKHEIVEIKAAKDFRP